MEGFHSFWARPGQVRRYGEVHVPDYEMLTMMLSALKWRERNGPIRMITDTPGAAFFARSGISALWDEVDTALDRVPEALDPYLFWAAGKLYALKTMPCPCAMLDTDLVIWKTLAFPPDLDVVAAHGEELYPDVYPDPRGFTYRAGYSLPAGWDFTLEAANTAFLYLRDADFRDYYTDCALAFMSGVEIQGLDPTTAMCFAEQRVLPMCAREKGRRLGWLLDLGQADGQKVATHVWGYKYRLAGNRALREAFCLRCVRRLLRDFPASREMLAGNDSLRGYLERAERDGNDLETLTLAHER